MIRTRRELEVTRMKLKMLEEHYNQRKQEPTDDEHVRDLSLRSVERWINKLKEEIIRYEAHAKAKS